jgi:hypothetical protein
MAKVVRMIKAAVGPDVALEIGKTYTVADQFAKELVDAGAAQILTAEQVATLKAKGRGPKKPQQPDPADELKGASRNTVLADLTDDESGSGDDDGETAIIDDDAPDAVKKSAAPAKPKPVK